MGRDVDGKPHSMPTVPSTAEKVVRPFLCEIEHVSPSLCDVCHELLLTASLIVCLVHLKYREVVLVEDEIFKSQMNIVIKIKIKTIESFQYQS